ncbi:MAG: hypothetical protein ACI9CF_000204 [Candidatus Omnitrophota bacterium]|jgi:hypothetical protein
MGSNQKILLILGVVLMVMGAFMNITTRKIHSNTQSASRSAAETTQSSSLNGNWGDSDPTSKTDNASTKSYFGS